MKNKCGKGWFRRLAGLTLILLATAGRSGTQSLPLISWRLSADGATLHEPVIMTLSVANTGRAQAALDLGANFKEHLLVTIITPSGFVDRRPPIERSDGVSRIGVVSVAPGETYERKFVINEWYPFEVQGVYRIRVELQTMVKVGGLQFAPPGENFHTILISGFDAPSLEKRCEDLTALALDPDGGEDVMFALNALQNIRDPLVVPYLSRLLTSPSLMAQGAGMRAVSKFSTREAADALLLTAGRNGVYAGEAKSRVSDMADRITDRALQSHIRDSLATLTSR